MTGVISYLIGLVEAGDLEDSTLMNEFLLSLAASVTESVILTVIGLVFWFINMVTGVSSSILPSYLTIDVSLSLMGILTGYGTMIVLGTALAMVGIYTRYTYSTLDFIE